MARCISSQPKYFYTEANLSGGPHVYTSEMSQTEQKIIRKAAKGDRSAFRELVLEHSHAMFRLAWRLSGDQNAAEDIVQEAFIKAWKALPKFESRARFTTWLFRISHNVVYDWLRKRRIQGEGELNDEVFDAGRIDPGAPTAPKQEKRPDEALEQSELQQRIEHAIGRLSEEHRDVILLREVQGLDYKEIAEVTGNSLGTVMSRLFYARKKLQNYLEPEI